MTSISLRQTAWLVGVLTLAACSGPQESAPQAGSTTAAVATSTTESVVSTPTTVQEAIEVTRSMTSGDLEPGTYYVDPDGSSGTEMTVEFTISETGWEPFRGTFKPGNAEDYVAVKAQIVTEVASPACDSTIFVDIGPTALDLATALAEIEDFPIQTAPTEVTAFGYDGYHLVLEVPDTGYEPGQEFAGCVDGYFDGYQGPTIGRYYQGPGQVVEFWAFDVEGFPLLIEATWFPDSPAEDVEQLQAILDSIVIRP